MQEDKQSHKNILKATSIVGGAQVVSILITILRTKFVALLLGPSGVGLIGMFQSATDLVRQTTSFGINYSGVKEIADASNSDEYSISRTITIVRRWALYTGILGMVTTLVLSLPLSYFAFDTDKYTIGIAILSITLLTTSISNGQLALLQGLRQIRQMAKATIIGALTGLVISVPLYWKFGIEGIVPSMILISLVTLITSWFFTRKFRYEKPQLSFRETIRDGLNMAKLGFFILITGVVVTATMLAIRSIVTKKLDLNAVGCFQSVYSISTLYIGIILIAMQSDFFPRLSAIDNDLEANILINHQVDMAVVISSPFIISLIIGAELVIKVLLTSSFLMGVPILQWQLLGGFFGIICWALGVMFLAKGKGFYSLLTEGIWSAVYFLFVLLSWDFLGFSSLGIGYVVAGLIRIVCVIIITRNLGGYTFDKRAIKTILTYGSLVIAVFINVQILTGIIQYIISFAIVTTSFYLSYSRISEILNLKEFIRSKFYR